MLELLSYFWHARISTLICSGAQSALSSAWPKSSPGRGCCPAASLGCGEAPGRVCRGGCRCSWRIFSPLTAASTPTRGTARGNRPPSTAITAILLAQFDPEGEFQLRLRDFPSRQNQLRAAEPCDANCGACWSHPGQQEQPCSPEHLPSLSLSGLFAPRNSTKKNPSAVRILRACARDPPCLLSSGVSPSPRGLCVSPGSSSTPKLDPPHGHGRPKTPLTPLHPRHMRQRPAGRDPRSSPART